VNSPDPRVRAAVENWGPRLIANGVDYNDFVRTAGGIVRWDEWLGAWTATAEVHLRLGRAALDAGHQRSAGEAFLRAAVGYHFAKFVWVLDAGANRRATEAAVRSLYLAHALLDPTAERIEAPLADRTGSVVANLRRPAGQEPAPVVVLIPGLDSTKEEFWIWEGVFLRRGMATLSLDGPGQGETGFEMPIRPDYEVAVSAVIDALALADRRDLDLGRIGAAGVSLGGYYAPRAAAFEPRIKAVAGVSGPFDMSVQWESMPSLTRDAFVHHSGAADAAEARSIAAQLSLHDVASAIEQPCLVVTGRRDRVIPWEETKRIADGAARGEFVLYDEGTHVCNNIPFKYRPLVADWMLDRLR
jgi:dipeptidyl aminopeptidase/acylaminoacyl peptidase